MVGNITFFDICSFRSVTVNIVDKSCFFFKYLLVYRLWLRDHVTDATELHWLLICAQIQCKVCLLVHWAVNN